VLPLDKIEELEQDNKHLKEEKTKIIRDWNKDCDELKKNWKMEIQAKLRAEQKLEKIKEYITKEQKDIQSAVKQGDEWARSLDGFIDELKAILKSNITKGDALTCDSSCDLIKEESD